ncbi:MAG: tRNA (N6-isopentenyl adenosine(37)-C2)-methylthiotransferase MiaB [Ferrovibrio sp.]|uniref:tRNA (N6-isopentenyl adenosine(37)-C2)-methylthiotransferase MiaB n=1 Tax=Ferrovibrio sp. TaxID=1917215 RepID=UPI0026387883|nr:tRNA (N6-isopentenyl adenosine(37)-C2)-methylthiotransferase MiaB [Ferrovibrio sp.]MCW0233698.1 tRNA (N6-isopentenyl adenosine(37)-C2)-methylthiotransferase MiaB [Ferrovibrio sp.]
MAKKLFIKTHGCQMNVYDSARMADVLAPLGYAKTETPDDADMVIINTCHIREKAAEKVFSELGHWRIRKQTAQARGGDVTIAVAGCVAQAEGEELVNRAPFVDLVIGSQAYHRLPELLARAERARVKGSGGPHAAGQGILATEFPAESKFDHLPDEISTAPGPVGYLAIQEGCDKFCTFCVVPYTRGAEYSRPAEAIIREAERLMATGVQEIALLGQNVNAWHGEGPDGSAWSLGRLLRVLNDRFAQSHPRLRWRYTTSHPREMDDDLIAAHGEVAGLMPFLHLPIQAGSDAVLKAMNRGHRAEDYLRIVEKLRAARPDLALSGDFITGFPGETDADFEQTLQLVREARYAAAYSFKYSARPGTPGSLLPKQVPDAVSTERLHALQALLQQQSEAFNRACEGRVLDVLFERPGRQPGQLIGRSQYMQAVYVSDPGLRIGDFLPVTIAGGYANSLAGEIARREAA